MKIQESARLKSKQLDLRAASSLALAAATRMQLPGLDDNSQDVDGSVTTKVVQW